MDEEQFRAVADSVDRRGMWGAQDQRGALAFLTTATTLAATREVRDGVVIACGRAARRPPAVELSLDRAGSWVAINERRTADVHGLGSATHLDALGHFFYDGRTYNRTGQDVVRATGLDRHDITTAAGGVLARGVLLDLPALLGLPEVPSGRKVGPAEVERHLTRNGVGLERGDVLFVRSGAAPDPDDGTGPGGLSIACASWLHAAEVAVVVTDGGLDTEPSEVAGVAVPWHVLTLSRMGVRLVDLADLEPLAAACASRGRLSFLAVLAPLVLPGASGSPVTPLAVF